jgi:hypothetical protein
MLEVHTSELIASCPKQAQLRIEGKEHRTAETALVRGLVAHQYLDDLTHFDDADADAAWDAVIAKVRDEGRSMSAAAINNRESIIRDVEAIGDAYAERVMPLVTTLVGTELPVSLEMDIDGEPVRFASHIDKLYIGADPLTGEEALVLVDWKYHDEAPTGSYLARNLQFGMYQHAIAAGGLLVDGWPWVMPEGLPLRAYWCHLPNLKPYARGGSTTRDGETVKHKKGDTRPINRVMFDATVTDETKLLRAFAERVRMMRAGFFPAIPSKVGCYICNSSYACDAWGAFG